MNTWFLLGEPAKFASKYKIDELYPQKVIPFRLKGEVSALLNACQKQAMNQGK